MKVSKNSNDRLHIFEKVSTISTWNPKNVKVEFYYVRNIFKKYC